MSCYNALQFPDLENRKKRNIKSSSFSAVSSVIRRQISPGNRCTYTKLDFSISRLKCRVAFRRVGFVFPDRKNQNFHDAGNQKSITSLEFENARCRKTFAARERIAKEKEKKFYGPSSGGAITFFISFSTFFTKSFAARRQKNINSLPPFPVP